jgi:pimeloyl-ACP methyl ester carboxylesterase
VFSFVGPLGTPARVLHDSISSGAYKTVGLGFRAVGVGGDAMLARRRFEEGRPVSSAPRGAKALAALAGLRGDVLAEQESALVEPMTIREDGEPVDLPGDPSSRMVVFTHGLMGTEHWWCLGGRQCYGEQLREDIGATPVHLRYNTGRHISENGLELADLLESLVDRWPVELEEIALVGHSMGGLVSRSACCIGAERGDRWIELVRQTVTLGTPHMGAPLEQLVHRGSAYLDKLPETRPVANFLRRRSSGIRDLRRGSLVDEDWRDQDRDALRARAVREVPLLPDVTHCFVSATVTHSPTHPLGKLVGDWLVLQPSASGIGRTRRIPFEEEYGFHLGGAGHIALLNHPRVYEQLRGWLSS